MVKRVGFFHFGTGHGDPIGSLRVALEANPELKASAVPAKADAKNDAEADMEPETLIVLPEAFNIKKLYRAEGTPDTKRVVLAELQSMAVEWQIAFVAGLLIEEETGGPNPPYNSAYLIDWTGHRLICRKKEDDGLGSYTPYTPAPEGDDAKNPLPYGGVTPASLICMDGNTGASLNRTLTDRIRDRRRRLEEKLPRTEGQRNVICIPACEHYGYGAATAWPDDFITILANCDPSGCPSVVIIGGEVKVSFGDSSTEKSSNKIRCIPLP